MFLIFEQAEQVLLADSPLKEQIMSVRKMASTMQSIINLYARKHVVMETARIDLKIAELTRQLEVARKLPDVAKVHVFGNDYPTPDGRLHR